MLRNTASQTIGAQMLTAADGTAFTDAVTVYVTGDGGAQAVGSVGSGACVHEGNGYHSYAPAQAETNYSHIAFTFIGTGAAPATVQVYTKTGDAFARLGAPVGASISADIAAVQTDTNDIQTRLPAALVGGRMDSNAGAISGDAAAADNLEAALDGTGGVSLSLASIAVTAGVTISNAAGSALTLSSTGGNGDGLTASGNGTGDGIAATGGVTGRGLHAVGASGIRAESNAAAGNGLEALGTTSGDGFHGQGGTTGRGVHARGGSTSGAGFRAEGFAGNANGFEAIGFGTGTDIAADDLTAIFDRIGAPAGASIAADIAAIDALDAAGVRAALGMAAANLDTQLDALPTAAELATALASADDATLAAIAAVSAKLPAALIGGRMDVTVGAMQTDTLTAAAIAADAGTELRTGLATSAQVAAVLTTELTEDYAARGVQMTAAQGLYMILSMLAERRVVGDVLTTGALDGTAAMTFLLDDVVAPTEQTRAT